MLTLERAIEINGTMVTEDSLLLHEKNVCYAMGAMAKHFGEDPERWQAVGMLHDLDYQKYPDEHLEHTEEPLRQAGVGEEEIRAVLSHGYGLRNDVVPVTNMEKSLYTVDELTGIIQACARMRPNGITDLEVKSFMKKFKDKAFAAKCNRELIRKGCEMLGMELSEVASICIEGMREHAQELRLTGTAAQIAAPQLAVPEKKRGFYGSDAVSDDVIKLYDDLKACWCIETCSPGLRAEWSPENPSRGQCTITAFIAQDIYGGEVYGIPQPGGGFHCYNCIDGRIFDLASEQFGDAVLCYEGNPLQSREEHFADAGKYERYLLLKKKLEERRNDSV